MNPRCSRNMGRERSRANRSYSSNRSGFTPVLQMRRIMPGSTLSVDGSHADRVRLSLTPNVETLGVGVRRLAEAWEVYDTPIARRSTEPPVIV